MLKLISTFVFTTLLCLSVNATATPQESEISTLDNMSEMLALANGFGTDQRALEQSVNKEHRTLLLRTHQYYHGNDNDNDNVPLFALACPENAYCSVLCDVSNEDGVSLLISSPMDNGAMLITYYAQGNIRVLMSQGSCAFRKMLPLKLLPTTPR
jgi:hypothetical protein